MPCGASIEAPEFCEGKNPEETADTMFRYKQLAEEIESKIHSGTYQAGEKLPSVRDLHKKLNLSISTVYQAYMELETTGIIEARPKSGYYVSPVSLRNLRLPDFDRAPVSPQKVELDAMVNSVLKNISNPDMLPLSSSATAPELLPVKQLSAIVKNISGKKMASMLRYSLTEGNPELRRQIALRTLGLPGGICAEDIVVTTGCMEAVSLCLRSILKSGDTIAIESPTHFGFLQFFREMGLLVAEVPTHPREGADPDELEKIIRSTPVKACLFMPNFQNPLGVLMSDERKKAIVQLLNRLEIPLIEDDICGEMYYEGNRPSLMKSFDRKDLVLTCSSFSKTLAPGFRIGWVIAGKRFRDKILRIKAGSTVCTSTPDQHIVARFLSEGAYERHLRFLRGQLKKHTVKTALAIQKYFPEGTRLALPKGGSLLWVQLPPKVDGLHIYRRALDHNIAILPGVVCSAAGQFGNHIRIGCGHPFTDATEKGMETLGMLVREAMK
ncbi:MAG: PLP-dependent aminotransferase family protein [Desulfobacterales bacterium]